MEKEPGALYHGIILQHNQSPQFFEKRPEARHVIAAYNPLCGDKFNLYLDVENGVVRCATFYGYGCAVSKASASVLMTKIQGQRLEVVKSIVAAFLRAINSYRDSQTAIPDEETAAFLPARDFPGRLGCATLAWENLGEFLNALPSAPWPST